MHSQAAAGTFSRGGERALFAKCKRFKKDSLRKNQQCWIAKALAVGVPINAFLIVEWTVLQ